MQHSFWNMYSMIQTGILCGKKSIRCGFTPLCLKLLSIFYKEGYINGFRVNPTQRGVVEIFLKYSQGKPVIQNLVSPSKPGCRYYKSVKTGWKTSSSFSISVFSSPKGIVAAKDCRHLRCGGEVLGFLF